MLPFNDILPKQEKELLIYPGITNKLLLSIGQICDDNCLALFSKNNLHIFKEDKLILSATHNFSDSLWDMSFPSTSHNHIHTSLTMNHQINYIIQKDTAKNKLARYFHGDAFYPVTSTSQQNIKNGNFITWPGIKNINFRKMADINVPTVLGRLHQERKNLQSTKLN